MMCEIAAGSIPKCGIFQITPNGVNADTTDVVLASRRPKTAEKAQRRSGPRRAPACLSMFLCMNGQQREPR